MEYLTTSSGVHNLTYRLAWCPRYGLPVLVGDVAADLEDLLREKAGELEVEIKYLPVQPDHVRLFVKAFSNYSPAKLVRHFKRYTSRVLRRRYKHLTTGMPTLWSRSCYVGSAGHVSDKPMVRHVAA